MTVTYYGSTGGTGGTSAANPPLHIAGGIGSPSTGQEAGGLGWLHGNKVWFYSSTNAPADMAGVAAFSDGYALGMKAGDLVLGITASGGTTTAYPWMGVIVCSAASTAPGGLVSTAGGQIASNFNT